MKKLKTALILLMAVVLTACASSDPTATNVPTSTETPATSTPTAAGDPTSTPAPTEEPTPTPKQLVLNDSTYTVTYDVAAGTFADAETLTTRAFTAVKADEGVLLSWRSFGEKGESFTVSKNGTDIYTGELTNYLDKCTLNTSDVYTLTYTANGEKKTETATVVDTEYREFTLSVPPETKLPNNNLTGHTANDMSVGDLDGDGELELIVKWYPDDAQDNSKDGWTGLTYLDAYDLDFNTCTATLMWRINLGLNIRSGAHYLQYQVWDYNGDGIAELICQTADGTTTYDKDLNETGHVGAVSMSQLDTSLTKKQQDYDYRQTSGGIGRVLSGPEYLTAFSGATGEIIDTVEYVPSRGPENEKGEADIKSWGDDYGNRSDRFLAGTAYIDDGTAAAIICRGYYARTALTAWKLVDNKLTMAWAFDAPSTSE